MAAANVIADKYRTYDIKSWKDAAVYGDGGGWCVAEQKSMYRDYMRKGLLWMVHAKSGGKWRAALCIYKNTERNAVEIAKRGNKHLNYFQLILVHKPLKPWLKEIGVSEPWPTTFDIRSYSDAPMNVGVDPAAGFDDTRLTASEINMRYRDVERRHQEDMNRYHDIERRRHLEHRWLRQTQTERMHQVGELTELDLRRLRIGMVFYEMQSNREFLLTDIEENYEPRRMTTAVRCRWIDRNGEPFYTMRHYDDQPMLRAQAVAVNPEDSIRPDLQAEHL